MNYINYVNRWLEGVRDELLFWEDYMTSEGGDYFRNFEWNVEPYKHFELEDELGEYDRNSDVRFVDVGSGPFSRCGCRTDLVNLDVTAVDPLAPAYNELKKQNHLENGVTIKTGFLELLHRSFEENAFDIVHMSNSMDHSFDPITGLYELLYICKIGGKVILRHAENEAENGGYQGLHQWNLSVHRKEGKFIIWNRDTEIDIGELLGDSVKIQIEADLEENTAGRWKYNKITLIKKEKTQLASNQYYDDLLWEIYGFLLKVLREDNKETLKRNNDKYYKRRQVQSILMKMLKKPQDYKQKLREMFPEGISIYGLGNAGKTLVDVCDRNEIPIRIIIDRREVEYNGRLAVKLDHYQYNNEKNIVVSLVDSFDDVKIDLIEHHVSPNEIVNLYDLLGRFN